MPETPAAKTPARLGKKKQVRLFIADEIRQEPGGKYALLGLYPDQCVVLTLPEGAPAQAGAQTQELIAFDGLCFLVNISGYSGKQPISIEFTDPLVNEKAGVISREADFSLGKSVTFVAKIRPYLVGQGDISRCVVVTVGDKRHELPYAVVSAAATAPKAKPRSTPAKKRAARK